LRTWDFGIAGPPGAPSGPLMVWISVSAFIALSCLLNADQRYPVELEEHPVIAHPQAIAVRVVGE
jgi:hypothetical protein